MNISEFDYELPQQLIAQHPLQKRNDSRLLVVNKRNGELEDSFFHQLNTFLKPGDCLILNNTRVFPARIFGQKHSGGKIEVLVERIINDKTVYVHLRSSKSPKQGSQLRLDGGIECEMVGRHEDLFILQLHNDSTWLELLQLHGHMPLPPYIERQDDDDDKTRYQTVYAKTAGAVAAPTAGLHFTNDQLDTLANNGVGHEFITLHVGAGTFQPVRGERIEDHVMHKEWASLTAEVCDKIKATKEQGGRVVAVGTTVTRCLEFAALSGELKAFDGDTDLFIMPGFKYNVVDAMITNFHLPKSTLLMLVSAFASKEIIKQTYRHAIEKEYRFFSYGDAMLIV
ncbi:MAG: tRNA preQ1(34) S-adenosylmethionine ribosyltransferase-isomerase QueA [Gammaproteobacteria bacterium]|nr:tRNA preQ1(34) S-adenosylmethionine ribosyltransferase-isomerase QueA [Gammaproteobacteria bacterium]